MIKAIPININGDYIGAYQEFTDEQWNSMEKSFGKNLRWKLLQDMEEESVISKGESEKIFGEGLEDYTKRELIEKYELSEDLMKLTKNEIIYEILK